ncbi:MAG: GIY-YIG nuclease family protein [Ignavibacteria bacterium]|nr:GIY-YIG nuclease family protein [Ignavibacteria bacterium]
MNQYYVYIMTNHSKTLFTGVTNNLKRRVYEHKNKLVYFEETQDITSAIAREKQIKGWLRRKKIDLIESINPEWKDLSDGWF